MSPTDPPPLNAAGLARARELFHLALESGLTGPQLQDWVADQCADDPSLAPLVLDLLKADAAADAATRWNNDSGGLLGVAAE